MKSLGILLVWVITLGVLRGAALWNGTDDGMSIEQVKGKFLAAIAPKDPTELFGGISEGLRIPAVTYLDKEFLVHFYFNKGLLNQVTLTLKDKIPHADMVKRAEQAATDLSKQFGAPKSKKETKDVTCARFEASWETSEQTVSIFVISTGPTDALYMPICFNINYQRPKK